MSFAAAQYKNIKMILLYQMFCKLKFDHNINVIVWWAIMVANFMQELVIVFLKAFGRGY